MNGLVVTGDGRFRSLQSKKVTTEYQHVTSLLTLR